MCGTISRFGMTRDWLKLHVCVCVTGFLHNDAAKNTNCLTTVRVCVGVCVCVMFWFGGSGVGWNQIQRNTQCLLLCMLT